LGGARTAVLVATAFVVGAGATALWLKRSAVKPAGEAVEENAGLSPATLQALAGLNAPLEIRYHAVLDRATVPAATFDFSQRVSRLLDAYARAANGRIKVVRQQGTPEEAVNAAAADKMKPFNQDAGDPCFLGMLLTSGERREALPQLAEEWEQALESDLTRAIVRVGTAPAATAALVKSQPAAATVEAVRATIPDLANVSLADGTQLLRERSLKAFGEATKEMQARLEEAQQRIVQAQASGSQADQQSALEALKSVQAEQTEKLKQISAELQEQIAALEYLKKK
jgi:hypothetical protein